MTLQLRHVTKTFGGQRALSDVDLSVAYGEVHALVGQNGSGKSTLIKLLSGYHQPDPGATAEIDGRPFQLGHPHAAREAGLRFVHQDLALVLTLSILNNVMLGRQYPTGLGGRIQWRSAAEQVAPYLAQVGVRADLAAPVGSLSMAERSAVAIARALSDTIGDQRLLVVLDEPTAALPPDEVSRLLDAINALRTEGHGVLLVSHHLNEVLDVADKVTVLRDGAVAASVPRREVDFNTLTELIVGHAVVIPERADRSADPGEAKAAPALRVRQLRGLRIEGLDLDIYPGEIVGVAGITGSGRESLGPLLTGRISYSGTVHVGDERLQPGDPKGALSVGVASIPGERARYGTFPNLNVRTNMTISLLKRNRRWLRLVLARERKEVDGWIDKLGIVTRGCDAPILSLSGGNQQKVLVGRALRLRPKVLILDDPTQGIDIGARAQIHDVIEECAADGMAILLTSTDSDELARLADRVIILVGGRAAAEMERGPSLTAQAIDVSQLNAEITHPHPIGVSTEAEG